MVPTFPGRGIGGDTQLNGERANLLLCESNTVEAPIGLCQLLAGIPDLVVLALELALTTLALGPFKQLPGAVNSPVPQHAHCSELERPRHVLGGMEEEVPNHAYLREVWLGLSVCVVGGGAEEAVVRTRVSPTGAFEDLRAMVRI